MEWRDVLLDGMLFAAVSVVIGTGFAIVYFLVSYAMKGIDEGNEK